MLNALPKRIPFVTRKIIQLAFTKATLGTMIKIDWFFKRHILKISRRVGHQAGAQFPVLLSKAYKRSQIPLALLPSLSPHWKSCPFVLQSTVSCIFQASSGFLFVPFYVFQISLPLMTLLSASPSRGYSKPPSLTL